MNVGAEARDKALREIAEFGELQAALEDRDAAQEELRKCQQDAIQLQARLAHAEACLAEKHLRLALWEQVWTALNDMGAELGDANKPLAVTASWTLLRTRLARELDGIAALEKIIVERGARLAEAEARHQRVMAVIRPFCAKYAPDLLAEFDAAAGIASEHTKLGRADSQHDPQHYSSAAAIANGRRPVESTDSATHRENDSHD